MNFFRNKIIFLLIIALALIMSFLFFLKKKELVPKNVIRYVALGDSYSLGQGVSSNESWPSLLTTHLNAEGIQTELYANISQTGWTSKQLIDSGLQGFLLARPDFGTLQIGVNDWIQYVDENSYRNRIAYIIEKMLGVLPSKERLLVVTLPDFSTTPEGRKYGGGRNVSEGILRYNEIIREEAVKVGVVVVDIFSVSQGMLNDPELIASDGLHPSAQEYTLWEQVIFPHAKKALK